MATIQQYFEELEKETLEAYKIASKARARGYDPDTKPEIVIAKNLAERVIGLISVVAPQLRGTGSIKRIVELEKEYGVLDWRVAFQIALEVAQEKFCKFTDKREAMEVGIRVGFAYVTLGAVSAPLEGFTTLELKPRRDGRGDFFCLNFAGPVRAAGGTAAAVCILIADYVRHKMGYAPYDPDEREIKRCHAELTDYHEWVTNLQYFPSKEEMEFMVAHMPVEVSGDASEKYEISNVTLKDLPRIPTNRMRSGYCLIYSGCLPLKGPKLWAKLGKWGDEFDMTHWNWLEEFVKIQKTMKAKGAGTSNVKKKDDGALRSGVSSAKEVSLSLEKEDLKIKPDFTFIADLVAGRPVFGYPLRSGGFRLRYGRSRTSGYSAQSIHPATMHILNEFIAIGTQLKVERPGKAGAFTSCDTIDGPVVKLKDGSVRMVDSEKEAKLIKNDVEEIIYLGDTLINYGDFFDRAHTLVPAGYVQEEWIQEVERACLKLFGTWDPDKLADLVDIDAEKLDVLCKKPFFTKISAEAAVHLSTLLGVPLHPSHIFFWKAISPGQTLSLAYWIFKKGKFTTEDEVISLVVKDVDAKRELELLGAEHKLVDGNVVLSKDVGKALLANFGAKTVEELELSIEYLKDALEKKPAGSLALINLVSKVIIKDKCGTFIGARMGRPEKAKIRKLTSSPHTLFPVGEEGGKFRSIQAALEKGYINGQFAPHYCKSCKRETVFSVCEVCDNPAEKMAYCKRQGRLVVIGKDCEDCKDRISSNGEDCRPQLYKQMKFDIKTSFPLLLNKIKTNIYPDLIKGVKGTSNKEHMPEHLIKGILRAKH
ncbi:hypothetical protein JW711_00350, partial [Candidatus Woesearchaeota archaeon]|nr:hypothetical protein [Candidatus Woesearchaeota archaeon]